MKIPKRIQPLIEDGLIDEVLSQLMSGKEATVYVVRCGSDIRCAKVYKEASKRRFKQVVQYREGRKIRNTRRARAIEKGSKFGREEQENLWHNAEVDTLYKLVKIGVRVPEPYGCFNGVLLMKLITNENGEVAPRLNDVSISAKQAREDFDIVIRNIVRMLCVGLVHGDLSEFNVLLDADGPVIIDLPQAVNAVANNHAEWMLERDVNNMRNYYGMFAQELLETQYAKEIWSIYKNGKLTPDTELTGLFDKPEKTTNVDSVLLEIKEAFSAEQRRIAQINKPDYENQ